MGTLGIEYGQRWHLRNFLEEVDLARFPDTEVERLKREVSIERLAVSAGVPLGSQGDDLVGGCPFCAAADGLVVSPVPNLWRCGGCGAGGSVIDWVMAAEGVSMRHALELLRDGFTPTRLNGKPPGRSTVHRLDGPFSADLADAELLDAVVGFYHQSLLESPEARGFLAERRIADGEAVDRFRLGYANRTLGYRLPAKNRAPGKALRGRLKDLGVLRADTGHEHFNGSLVIPVLDEHGRVVQVYGRKIGSGLRKGTPLHLWLPGGPRGVWNLPALDSADEVVVCESLIDALSLWCVGFRNVTAAAGPEGFGEDLWRAFRERGVRRVVFAFDADPEGDKAAQDLAREFLAQGVECYRLRPPKAWVPQFEAVFGDG
jgi:DNA primase